MATRERNIPRHRWYQKRYHVKLTKDDYSREWFYPSAIEKIDNHIADLTYGAEGIQPALVLDFCTGFFGTRELDSSDFVTDGITPTLLLDFENEFFGHRELAEADYVVDYVTPALVLDFGNTFFGVDA